jgi:hypothetical protein
MLEENKRHDWLWIQELINGSVIAEANGSSDYVEFFLCYINGLGSKIV